MLQLIVYLKFLGLDPKNHIYLMEPTDKKTEDRVRAQFDEILRRMLSTPYSKQEQKKTGQFSFYHRSNLESLYFEKKQKV